MQDDLIDGLLADFLDESDQLLTQLNENLLHLDEWVRSLEPEMDQPCHGEVLNDMFRAAHSLKGLSAMLGLSDINALTHKIENVFDAARNNQIAIDGRVVDVVFSGLDRLSAQVESLKEPVEEPIDCDAVLADIKDLLSNAGAEREVQSQEDAEKAFAESVAEIRAETAIAPAGPQPTDTETTDDPFAEIQDDEDVPENYLAIFIDEADASLEELWESLIDVERGAGGENLRKPLGIAHKIKGAAASIGLNRAAKLAHLMEDQIEEIIHSGENLPGDLVDALLHCTGTLQEYVAGLRKGLADTASFTQAAHQLQTANTTPAATHETPPGLLQDLENLLGQIRARLENLDSKAVASAAGIASSTVARVQNGENVKLDSIRTLARYLDEETAKQARDSVDDNPTDSPSTPVPSPTSPPELDIRRVTHGGTPYSGQVVFEPHLPLVEMKALLVYEKLTRLGTVVHCDPPLDQLEEMEDLASFAFRVYSDQTAEAIANQIRVSGAAAVQLVPEGATTGSGSSSESNGAGDRGNTPGQTAAAPESRMTTSNKTSQNASPTGTAPENTSSETAPATESKPPATTSVAPKATRDPRQRTNDANSRPAETMRVDIERLDQLMDLAGQLVTNKAQFAKINDDLGTALLGKQAINMLNVISAELKKMGACEIRLDDGHRDEMQNLQCQIRRVQTYLDPLRDEIRSLSRARDCARDLSEAIHQLGRVSDGIQQGVMDTRMVPVGPLFSRFRRVVRDITRSNGKQIQLEIRGEKTELDKRMIDELGDPLVHMVRNSADHGVETPHEREAAGKPRCGTVTLDACHRGNSIMIRVSDDGKGLNTDRILQKCLDKGILSPDDAENMSPHQVHQMIWEPGLSTAEKVTDVSGRGMGMDIVKSKIEELNGTVEIESVPGKGTTITIKLPLTLAILPSLMVEIGGETFAMPMEAVVEIVGVAKNQISTIHRRKTAIVRDRVVSVVQIFDALNFHAILEASDQEDEILLVLLGESGREIGLVVDRVVGEEDIVIKSIAENYRNIHGISGASILGDGRVSLILDTTAVIDMVSQDPVITN